MSVLGNHISPATFLRLRSLYRASSLKISYNIKLSEVPEICSSEEWNTTVQESRSTLQKHINRYRNLNVGGNRNLASVPMVVQRLQESHGSSHLIHTFKYLLENSDETMSLLRWPGLITLMLSQGVGYPFAADNFCSKALEDVIWSSQVVLAEIINILHCSQIFRTENWRVSSTKSECDHVKKMKDIDRLMYSYFTSSSIYKFSALQKYKENFKVIFLLSDVLESLSKKSNSSASTFNSITSKALWEYETFHSQGILLATGCQATLELAEHDEKSQKMAYEFGHLFTLAMKANADIQQFWNYQVAKSATLNLSSFPIALYLENNPEALTHIYTCGENVNNLEIYEFNAKLMPQLLLNDARQHLEDYISRTLNILEEFKSSKNNEMLEYLVKLVKTLNHLNEN